MEKTIPQNGIARHYEIAAAFAAFVKPAIFRYNQRGKSNIYLQINGSMAHKNRLCLFATKITGVFSVFIFLTRVVWADGLPRGLVNNGLEFMNLRVTNPKGKEILRYNSFRTTEFIDKDTFTIRTYAEYDDPYSLSQEDLETTNILLPDQNTFLMSGVSMGIGHDGIVYCENLPDGRVKVISHDHFTNWWSLDGVGYIDKDNTQKIRSELHNKSGALVYVYWIESRPATEEEHKRFESKRRLAMNRKMSPAVLRHRLNDQGLSYPDH